MRHAHFLPARENGNALIITLLILALLAAITAAQTTSIHADIKSSNFFYAHSLLRKYAESGIDLSVYDIRFSVTSKPGKIGTASWDKTYDHGRDGQPGTHDEGEGDGIPTPGEPGVYPLQIGPPSLGARLIVWVEDVAGGDIKRLVSTAYSGEALSSVERYVKITFFTVPRIGSLYVNEQTVMQLHGNSFSIEGRNHSKKGALQSFGHRFGISTRRSASGLNRSAILSQIASGQLDQIYGSDSLFSSLTSGSVDEVDGVNFTELVTTFTAAKTNDLAPGTYSSPQLGNITTGNLQVTHATGPVHLTGQGYGAGVLVVEGDLDITGSFDFYGLVLVTGSLSVRGGGAKVNVYGTTILDQLVNAVEPDPVTTIAGNAKLAYCSEVLDDIESMMRKSSQVSFLYYNSK